NCAHGGESRRLLHSGFGSNVKRPKGTAARRDGKPYRQATGPRGRGPGKPGRRSSGRPRRRKPPERSGNASRQRLTASSTQILPTDLREGDAAGYRCTALFALGPLLARGGVPWGRQRSEFV